MNIQVMALTLSSVMIRPPAIMTFFMLDNSAKWM